MDGWPKVALVSSPDTTATILYQFNTTRKAHVGHAGFDSGTAEWSGEPGAQGGTEGYRSIRFTHYVDGSDAAAVTALTTLSRLLMADYGWLLIQQRPTATPVWAKVWRSTPGALSWDRILLDDGAVAGKYGIDLELTADPHLYGEEITLATGIVVNDTAVSTANLLTANQASMETDVSNWSFNTALGARDAGTSVASSSTRAHVGTKSLLATWSTTSIGNYVQTSLTTIIGVRYLISAWVWVPTGSPNVRLSNVFDYASAFTSVKDAWVQLSVEFTAIATTTQVGIDQVASTNGQQCWIDDVSVTQVGAASQLILPDAVGDAPAPAVVTVTPTTRTDGALHLLHTTPVLATGTAAPVAWQVGTSDGWSTGAIDPKFAAPTTDADWSGGSYRATSGVTVGTGAYLNGSKTIQPGRYLVLVRAGQATGGTGAWRFTFYAGPLNQTIVSETWTVIAGSADQAHWHPVGIATFPQGSTLPPAVLAAEPTITADVALLATLMSGSGTLNVDAIVLLPVSEDSRTLRWGLSSYDSTITADTVDGELEQIYSRNPADSKLKIRPTIAMGGFPQLVPGPNALHMLGGLAGGQFASNAAEAGLAGSVPTNQPDLITTTNQVTVTYRPRWLWPRP